MNPGQDLNNHAENMPIKYSLIIRVIKVPAENGPENEMVYIGKGYYLDVFMSSVLTGLCLYIIHTS